jgi:RecA-family ATPase
VTLDLDHLAQALGGDVSRDQVLAPGPGHSREDRSLSIKLSQSAPDGFVVHSFAGDDSIKCKDYVRQKLGAPFKPNGHRARASNADFDAALRAAFAGQYQRGNVVAQYDYQDADGALLYQVVRLEPKSFRHRKPDGKGGWHWQGSERRVPYRLSDLLKYADASVFITEGEKDADRVASLGHCATTAASGEWTADCVKALAGRDCLILEDNDATGRKKALEAAAALYGTVKSVRIVRLPGLPDKGDVSDWLDADPRRADKLVDICFDAPAWKPDEAPPAAVADDKSAAPLPFIDMSRWDEEPLPERAWAVLDRVPLRQTALFSGEGGAGKSIVTLHECCAHVLGRDWLQSLPKPGPAIFIDAEDEETELHIRVGCIAQHYGVSFADLIKGGLHLLSFVGKDAVLATFSRSGKIESTPLYQQILEAAGDIKPVMIGIASSANVFAGSENDRSQVQQFVALLTRMAIAAGGSIQLISHPSLTGINTDSGLSGTTQWHNAVRARSYLRSIEPDSGEQPDNDLREIVFKKNQYGPRAETIVLRYQNGLFLPVPGVASVDRLAHEQRAKDVFLTLLERFTKANRNVSEKRDTSYAPALFSSEDEAKKALVTNKQLANAMSELFREGKIWNEPYGRRDRKAHRIARKEN